MKLHFIHDWGVWVDKDKGTYSRRNAFNEEVENAGTFVTQERRCHECGKVQIKIVKSKGN